MRAPAIRMEAVNAIHVSEGRRALREDAIPPLMDSIKRLGLQVPLAVRVVDECTMPDTGEVVCNVPLLVAGRHRLEACRRLGMETVPVVEFSDPLDAELWEIDENLQRSELTELERGVLVVRRDEIVSRKLRETSNPQGGRPGSTAATARNLNMSKDATRRAKVIGNLSEEAKEAAREVGLDDNQSALLAAAKAPDPAAELRRIKADKDAEEARRRNRETEKTAAQIAAEEFAEWLANKARPREIPMLITWLRDAKPRDVVSALRTRA